MRNGSEGAPLVDLVIAIHDSTRPLERGITSLLHQDLEVGPELRITVVCHNVDVDEVRTTLSERTQEAVRFLGLKDGIPSPAGPFNLGLANATAKYFSIMGSDDLLEPGAIRAWLLRAERDSLAAVIAPIRLADRSVVRTPPIRFWRRGVLDGVKDRLAYRSAPLGLIRRDALVQLGLVFAAGLSTGEDQLLCLKLWFSGMRVAYGRGDPRYLGGDGAQARVTHTRRTIQDDFRALEGIVNDSWFAKLSARQRRSIVTKIARVHLFALASSRSEADWWTDDERRYLTGFIECLREIAPGFERPFSVADRRLLDALGRADTPPALIIRYAHQRRRFGTPATLVTRSILGQFAAEGPLRFMIASALV